MQRLTPYRKPVFPVVYPQNAFVNCIVDNKFRSAIVLEDKGGSLKIKLEESYNDKAIFFVSKRSVLFYFKPDEYQKKLKRFNCKQLLKKDEKFYADLWNIGIKESSHWLSPYQISEYLCGSENFEHSYTAFKYLIGEPLYYNQSLFSKGSFYCRTEEDIKMIEETIKFYENNPEIVESLKKNISAMFGRFIQGKEVVWIKFTSGERLLVEALYDYICSDDLQQIRHPYKKIFKELCSPLCNDHMLLVSFFHKAKVFDIYRERYMGIDTFSTNKFPVYEKHVHKAIDNKESNAVAKSDTLFPFAMDNLRHDFGNMPAFAIDSLEASEIDDSISIEVTDDHCTWIHVHIADPTYLLSPKSKLTLFGQRRATTMYFPTGHIPLFPKTFTQMFSLDSGKINKCITFSYQVDSNGEIIDRKIRLSVVSNLKRITYDEVDSILESYAQNENYNIFKQMLNVAGRLKHRRFLNNARDYDLPKIKPKISKIGESVVIKLVSEKDTPSKLIVTELMIAANYSASAFANEHKLPYLHRLQPDNSFDFNQVSCILNSDQSMSWKFVNMLNLFPFIPHAIDTVNFAPHVSLGIGCYSRVTSPLRRFTDIINHFQIKASLSNKALAYYNADLQPISEYMNSMNLYAKTIEKQTGFYWTIHLLLQKLNISKTITKTPLMAKGWIVPSNLDNEEKAPNTIRVFLHEYGMVVSVRSNGQKYKAAEEVNVQILKADPFKMNVLAAFVKK